MNQSNSLHFLHYEWHGMTLCGMHLFTGYWRHVDFSYNNLGAGAALVLGELCDKLGQVAAQ